jgi:hypothetical protein
MKTSYAELKPIKLGETLPGSAEGNPDPSLGNKEGVEARWWVCTLRYIKGWSKPRRNLGALGSIWNGSRKVKSFFE